MKFVICGIFLLSYVTSGLFLAFEDCPKRQNLWDDKPGLVKCYISGADSIKWETFHHYNPDPPRPFVPDGNRRKITEDRMGVEYKKVIGSKDFGSIVYFFYDVTARNSETGERIYRRIKVYENAPVQFFDCPTTQYAAVGETVHVRCKTKATPSYFVYVQRFGKNLDPWDGRTSQRNGVIIRDFRLSDYGKWTILVIVGNRDETIRREIMVYPKSDVSPSR